ncbi:MAG: hypothetical protein MUE74_04900 [Bacteroidales bacterium]|jgi:hypothetical protein|nr:hypothetical protein [Bacteroidales bacterium]
MATKKIFIFLITAVILGFSVVSCGEIESLPVTPRIEFTSFEVFDTTNYDGTYKAGRLKFYFEDGDGDIGLNPPVYPFDDAVNLFFSGYRKTGNIFVEVTDSLDPVFPYDYRIPFMERLGQNKILKGTVAVTFLYQNYMTGNTDTIKYEFFIRDRAQHHSDTIMTVEIPLSFNGLYKQD